jgi:hypothetical protein
MHVTSIDQRPNYVEFSSDMPIIMPVTGMHFSNKKINSFSTYILDSTIRWIRSHNPICHNTCIDNKMTYEFTNHDPNYNLSLRSHIIQNTQHNPKYSHNGATRIHMSKRRLHSPRGNY